MALDAPLHIHHDNDYGWWENQEKMKLARDQGYNAWASDYPWTAGSGNYGASILAPDNWEVSMGYKYEETMFEPQLDRFVTKEEFMELAEAEPGRTAIAFSPPARAVVARLDQTAKLHGLWRRNAGSRWNGKPSDLGLPV